MGSVEGYGYALMDNGVLVVLAWQVRLGPPPRPMRLSFEDWKEAKVASRTRELPIVEQTDEQHTAKECMVFIERCSACGPGGIRMDWTAVPVLVVIFVATLIRSAFGFGEALIAVPL